MNCFYCVSFFLLLFWILGLRLIDYLWCLFVCSSCSDVLIDILGFSGVYALRFCQMLSLFLVRFPRDL